MPGCAVVGCGNYNRITKGTQIRYFKFPKNKELSKKWEVACRRHDPINLKNATICSSHFESNCFEYPLKNQLLNFTPKNERNLKCDAVPTVFLDNSERSINRLAKRRQYIDISQKNGSVEESLDISCTDEQTQIKKLQLQLLTLEKENSKLTSKLEMAKKHTRRMKTMMGKLFTPGQVKRMLYPKKKSMRWSSEDIASAISLRSVSLKAYRYLRSNGYPLPAVSTLRKALPHFRLIKAF